MEFEIFFSKKKILSFEIKDGQVDHFRTSRELGLALRILNKGRMGFTYLFGPTHDSLTLLTDRTVELANDASDTIPEWIYLKEADHDRSNPDTSEQQQVK